MIIQAVVLRLAFPGAGTAACVAVAGAGLALLDHHLRAHRAAFLGRWIGPATILAVAGWLAAVTVETDDLDPDELAAQITAKIAGPEDEGGGTR